MTETAAAVVRKQVVVEAPQDKAFAVFTEQLGDFKPPEHNLLTVAIAETVLEPRVGGHIYDRGTDGSECRWARVLAFEPPRRVVFSWDIGPTWQLETEPENASEVEVRFIAETADRTRVELEHRNIDRVVNDRQRLLWQWSLLGRARGGRRPSPDVTDVRGAVPAPTRR
jgi:uncharacterized protein YndB with AHSA1/START domain